MNMTKIELQKALELSLLSMTKLNYGDNLGTGVLLSICKVLDIYLSDIK